MEFLKVDCRLTRFYAFCLIFVILGSACVQRPNQSLNDQIEEEVFDGFSYAYLEPVKGVSGERALYLLFHPTEISGDEYIRKWVPLIGAGPYVILAPTASASAPYGSKAFQAKLIWMIRNLEKRYGVHPEKRFLIGESSGAIFGYQFLAEHPDFFKAAVLISGALKMEAWTKLLKAAPALRTKFLVIHGVDDSIFPLSMTEREVVALHKLGLSVTLKSVKHMAHDSNESVKKETVEWLNQQWN